MTEIVLVGGPSGLGPVYRTEGTDTPDKLQVAHYGQHVHFERTHDVEVVDGRELPVYRFSYSTAIAE
ncbi:DUF5988 family protein [Embleya sp. NBC_00896]|uniref:DUF5988 family protein n=1 Tax=Embleya sp. NBC_00896 TaxID=2975961 RepID=UPI002F914230|nr:DUF5988 family protein [Embleya sp. NBC_00896]